MSSFAVPSPASDSNALPPSGDGQSYRTAQYTSELNKDLTQPSFIVYRQLQPVKWLRCTYTEAEYYKGLNYQVWSSATGRMLRSPHAAGTAQEVDQTAFLEQYEKVVKAEDALETADIQVTHDEGLMEDVSDGGDPGEDIFDEPLQSSKEQSSPKGKCKGKG